MQGSSVIHGKPNLANQVLLAAGTRTENGTGEAVPNLGEWRVLLLQLDVTAASEAEADTLDVYVQTTIDGTNWVDIYHFTQVVGDGGAVRHFGKLVWDASLTEFENGAALSAGGGRSIFGDQYRVRWVVADDTDPSFTFSVAANLA